MKPAVLVTRAVFPDVVERLRQFFEVEDNPGDYSGAVYVLSCACADASGPSVVNALHLEARVG